jgi:hypothetical protein
MDTMQRSNNGVSPGIDQNSASFIVLFLRLFHRSVDGWPCLPRTRNSNLEIIECGRNRKVEQEEMFNNRQPNVGSQRPLQDKYERFKAWLKENGAQLDLVSHFIGISSEALRIVRPHSINHPGRNHY